MKKWFTLVGVVLCGISNALAYDTLPANFTDAGVAINTSAVRLVSKHGDKSLQLLVVVSGGVSIGSTTYNLDPALAVYVSMKNSIMPSEACATLAASAMQTSNTMKMLKPDWATPPNFMIGSSAGITGTTSTQPGAVYINLNSSSIPVNCSLSAVF